LINSRHAKLAEVIMILYKSTVYEFVRPEMFDGFLNITKPMLEDDSPEDESAEDELSEDEESKDEDKPSVTEDEPIIKKPFEFVLSDEAVDEFKTKYRSMNSRKEILIESDFMRAFGTDKDMKTLASIIVLS